MPDGFFVAAAPPQHVAQIVVRFGGIRTQRDAAFIMRDRRVEIVKFCKQVAEIVMRAREAGIDRQRALVAADCLLVTACCVEAATDVDVRVRQGRIGR